MILESFKIKKEAKKQGSDLEKAVTLMGQRLRKDREIIRIARIERF